MAAAIIAALLSSCGQASGRDPETAGRSHPTSSVILITIDGARPSEIFEGVDSALAHRDKMEDTEIVDAVHLVPNLRRLSDEVGVGIGEPSRGAPFVASGHFHVSLPGYYELITGTEPLACLDNQCRPKVERTLLDDFRVDLELPKDKVAVFSSWGAIARVATSTPDSTVVSSGPDYRPDDDTASLALRHLIEHRPRFLWVSLGDTDEAAHKDDYRGYLESLRRADRFVGDVLALLDTLPNGHETSVVVTTDHGRSKNFKDHGAEAESAPIWLVAGGGRIPKRGIVALESPRALSDVTPTVQALAGLPPTSSRRIEALLPD